MEIGVEIFNVQNFGKFSALWDKIENFSKISNSNFAKFEVYIISMYDVGKMSTFKIYEEVYGIFLDSGDLGTSTGLPFGIKDRAY